jgi:hypothetical protein
MNFKKYGLATKLMSYLQVPYYYSYPPPSLTHEKKSENSMENKCTKSHITYHMLKLRVVHKQKKERERLLIMEAKLTVV